MGCSEQGHSPEVRKARPGAKLLHAEFLRAAGGTDRGTRGDHQPKLGGNRPSPAPNTGCGNLSSSAGMVNGAYFQVGGGTKQKLAADGTGVLYNFIKKNDFDWVALAEHQLKNTGSLPKIPGYYCIAKSAKRSGGGVCFFYI